MNYPAIITREADFTLATFPDCPGCQTFAAAGEDVYEEAKEALEGWLESNLEHGEAPPKPSDKVRSSSGARVVRVDVSPALAVRLQLRWARQAAGISQGELARRIGVSRQAVAQLESPDANLRLGTLERVAAALGQDVEITFRPSSTRSATDK
jgi:predicted RNase H-like HicB family nuclease/DNA-binding XRE family transcriptional regulator